MMFDLKTDRLRVRRVNLCTIGLLQCSGGIKSNQAKSVELFEKLYM